MCNAIECSEIVLDNSDKDNKQAGVEGKGHSIEDKVLVKSDDLD